MEVKSVSLGCFLTLADVYAFMCMIFYHWRFYLWSWAWRVPPVPPSLLRLQKSPVVTIPTSRTSIYWVPNHLPGPNNVCTCYLLYSSQKPYEAYDIIIPYFTSEETETQNGQVTYLFMVSERGAEPGVKHRQSDFRVWIQLEWIWYTYMLAILTNFFNWSVISTPFE